MTKRLIEIARRIQDQPWNRYGTDKTWVLEALLEHQLFSAEVGRAVRGSR